jgi:hypothetical protein
MGPGFRRDDGLLMELAIELAVGYLASILNCFFKGIIP